MTQSGGAENTSSSVTLYNFQKSGGGGAEAPQPLPLRGPCRCALYLAKFFLFNLSHTRIETDRW